MSGTATLSEASVLRIVVHDNAKFHDVFEVVSTTNNVIRVRSPFLFEIGEVLHVRIERDGCVYEATAQVRSHTGDDVPVTELEISHASEPHSVVSG